MRWLFWVSLKYTYSVTFPIQSHFRCPINMSHFLSDLISVVASNPMMRSTTNILIINLAFADLLFVIFCEYGSHVSFTYFVVSVLLSTHHRVEIFFTKATSMFAHMWASEHDECWLKIKQSSSKCVESFDENVQKLPWRAKANETVSFSCQSIPDVDWNCFYPLSHHSTHLATKIWKHHRRHVFTLRNCAQLIWVK